MQDNRLQNDRPGRRRLNGMLVILFVVAVLIILNYKPSIERVHCNQAILDTGPDVIMLGTGWCPYCYEARRYLTQHNISYCEYDIERSPEGEKLYSELDAQVIPVLLVGRYTISGFDEARLEQLLNRSRQRS